MSGSLRTTLPKVSFLCVRSNDWFMPACRVPPRRAGNFLLLAQKKVTKEECLKTNNMHFYR